jgi:uncharacterized protein (TIGR00251 family)
LRLAIRVIPNARRTEFTGWREGEIVLRLAAPPHEGKANKAAVEFLAEHLGVPRSSISLISGEKSRRKIFEIRGVELSDIEGRLV